MYSCSMTTPGLDHEAADSSSFVRRPERHRRAELGHLPTVPDVGELRHDREGRRGREGFDVIEAGREHASGSGRRMLETELQEPPLAGEPAGKVGGDGRADQPRCEIMPVLGHEHRRVVVGRHDHHRASYRPGRPKTTRSSRYSSPSEPVIGSTVAAGQIPGDGGRRPAILGNGEHRDSGPAQRADRARHAEPTDVVIEPEHECRDRGVENRRDPVRLDLVPFGERSRRSSDKNGPRFLVRSTYANAPIRPVFWTLASRSRAHSHEWARTNHYQ